MKRLRVSRSTSTVRRRGGRYLVLVGALVVCLGTFAVPAASARHFGRRPSRAIHQHHGLTQPRDPTAAPTAPCPVSLGVATCHFNRGAIFTCFGAFNGIPTASYATFQSSYPLFPTVFAVVHLVGARPFTRYTLELYTSGCQSFGFAFTMTDGSGTSPPTPVTASFFPTGPTGDAFAVAIGGGDFLVTPEAFFPSGF
jgi:hypothetical protein